MTSKHIPNIFTSSTGFLAVMREFLASVDRLNQTVLFPVKLQDLDQSQLTPDDQLLHLIKQTTDDDKEGESSSGDSLLGQQLKTMAGMLKSLTKMANTIRGQYETSMYLS